MRSGYILVAFLLCTFTNAGAQEILTLQENGETPSHNYDVLHYAIDVRIDEVKKSVAGKVAITLVPFFPNLEKITLNAGKMTIGRVTLGGKKDLKFDAHPYTLDVHLDKPYSWRDTLNISVEYSCTPTRGMTFYAPDSGYPSKRTQFWSQGEDTTNHFWFPCYDHPNDKATSEVTATVNKKFTVLSNGKLISVKENKADGTKTFHWKESKPHSSYLIMVAGGEYAVLHDKAGKLPVDYYVYPNDTLNARINMRETPKMITFFNEKIGFPYAWEKYGQIILQDHFGGMENSSATTLSDLSTVYDARVRTDQSPAGLIGHELAHQWWGDVVTCKDFRHIWLNESFASYFDPLYTEHSMGRDEFDYQMYGAQQAGITVDTTQGRKPIVSEESYFQNVYPRGASVLHMLRFVLGEELFWKSINHYITKHQFQPVETNDFKMAIEEATGQNLYWFFDQWVYKAGHPIFDVAYTWSDSAKAVFLSVKQTQKMDSLTGIFRTPVDIEVTTPSGASVQSVNILTKDTIFTIPSAEKPILVIFDKGNWLIKEIKFEKTKDELVYQATRATRPIERIRALQALAGLEKNEEFIPTFADRMVNDQFWAVRREAATLSGKIKPADEAGRSPLKTALMAAYKDKKAAVRDAAIGQLGSFKGGDVAEFLTKALDDSSYSVMGSALRSLAKVDSTNSIPVLTKYLDYPSYRNRVANTALIALATVDSTQALKLALEKAKYGQNIATRFTALGMFSKYGKGNPDVVALCRSLLDDKNENVRSNAARTLGTIGDESVIPILEPIANDKENAASTAAKDSIEKIKKRSASKTESK